MEELETCIERVIKLLKANQEDGKKFDYNPHVYYWNTKEFNNYNYYGYGYGYGNNYKSSSYKDKDVEVGLEVMFYRDGKEESDFIVGESFEECVGIFLLNNPDLSWGSVFDYNEV